MQATPHLNTLSACRRRRNLRAGDGRPGGKQRMSGAAGGDLVVDVPVGTIVADVGGGEIIADLAEPGATATVARGGRGGMGNWHFKSSVNRAPRRATPGGEGQQRRLHLELRLLADVGLVGFPNAGKSSLIRALTRARPKVGAYPFTTLVPNLGVVEDPYGDGFVIADVPGLIEGAAQGAGLGHQFLRHLARNRVLVHVLEPAPDAEAAALLRRHEIVLRELAQAPVPIAAPVRLIVLNKADLLGAAAREELPRRIAAGSGCEVVLASAASGEGVEALRRRLTADVAAARAALGPARIAV